MAPLSRRLYSWWAEEEGTGEHEGKGTGVVLGNRQNAKG